MHRIVSPIETPATHEASSSARAWTSEVPDVPDVRDMAIVHSFYRREFELAPRILRNLRPGEVERRAAAQQWFGVTIFAMRHHHMAEDALMYPLMTGKVPDSLLEPMRRQHEVVAAGVEHLSDMLARWILGEAGSQDRLAAAYDRLLPALVEHLDEEERDIVPLIADCMTGSQYDRKATSGNDYEPHLLMMCFGAMIEECSPEDADFMLSHLPGAVSRSWHDHIAEEYWALMRLLRGSLQLPGPVGR